MPTTNLPQRQAQGAVDWLPGARGPRREDLDLEPPEDGPDRLHPQGQAECKNRAFLLSPFYFPSVVLFPSADVELQDHHDLKQIPFNGKKLKPATLRKDYWSPMAIIEFPQGLGSVGRSVFQKLRELKHLHEVSWPEDMRLKTEDEYTEQDIKRIKNAKEEGRTYVPVRTKRQRGAALCAQKKNSIADMAAVLAGQGRGNKIVAGEGEGELVPVTVNWANDQDKRYAESWSDNVTHGLVEKPAYVLGDDVPEPTKTNPVLRAT